MGSTSENMMIKQSSNFARTCNRFSRFLNERRSLVGDVHVSSPKLEIKSLLYHSKMEMEMDTESKNKSLELFPLTSSSSAAHCSQKLPMNYYSESSKLNEEPKKTTASMTIIYDGKVVVVDDLKAEMAQEILSLASNGALLTSQHESPSQTTLAQGLYDFPMTRRISLHRFIEKRKERIASIAPYQLVQSSMASVHHTYPEKYNLMKKSYMQQEEHQLELKL